MHQSCFLGGLCPIYVINVITTGFQGTFLPRDYVGKGIILVGTLCAVVKSTVLPSVG